MSEAKLTKCEQIAAMAMQGLLANPCESFQILRRDAGQGFLAELAVAHADALLLALSAGKETDRG